MDILFLRRKRLQGCRFLRFTFDGALLRDKINIWQGFSKSRLPERVHEALIQESYTGELVGHISRDSTAIEAREKPVKKSMIEATPARRGRPKKGEVRVRQQTRIEKQVEGMALSDMIADLPTVCSVGTKKNSKGYKESWIGYKLHLDVADGGIPVSGLLTSASTHDSQVDTKVWYTTDIVNTNWLPVQNPDYTFSPGSGTYSQWFDTVVSSTPVYFRVTSTNEP